MNARPPTPKTATLQKSYEMTFKQAHRCSGFGIGSLESTR